MFETAEVGNKVEKERYKKEAVKLRAELLSAQKALAGCDRSVVILIGGVEGAGKAQLVDLLLEWLDARGVEVHAFAEPSDEERERPRFWRFWRVLPPKGRLAVILGSWYTGPIVDRVFKRSGDADLEQELDRVVEFEQMLVNEDVVLVKLWMHISKGQQKKRLRELEKDADTRWRVTKTDWKFFKRYDRFRAVSEQALLKTSTGEAPWSIVEATDNRYRNLTACQIVLQALAEAVKPKEKAKAAPSLPKPKKLNPINSLDRALKIPDKEYKDRYEKLQARLALLSRRMREEGRSMILVFEGSDAAGKGGAIRRLTRCLDARSYRVISTAAPTEDERARPYLWRFWRDLPRRGRTTIYDRSWYGRVLVERLEGFCAPEDWKRAYGEIDAFEEQVSQFGTVIVKFWLAISPEEQLRRFKERQLTPYKQYKITEEDWRNRKKWDGYEAAACEMIERTSTAHAPWVLVEANDKNWARIKVMTEVCERLEKALE